MPSLRRTVWVEKPSKIRRNWRKKRPNNAVYPQVPKYEFKKGNVFHFFHYLLLFSLVLRSWVTYLILDCPFSVLLLLLASIHSRSSNAFIVLRSKGLSCRTVISQSSRALSTRLKVWTCSESLWNGGRICIRLKLKIGSV